MAVAMDIDIGHPENLIRLVLAALWLGKSEAIIPCLKWQLLLYNLTSISLQTLLWEEDNEMPFKEIFISKSKHQGNHLEIIIINS